MTTSFERMAIIEAYTKRSVPTDGVQGTPTTQTTSISCTPLDPIRPEVQHQLELGTPYQTYECFCEESDIIIGDILVIDSVEYNVLVAANWNYRGNTCMQLIVEKLNR